VGREDCYFLSINNLFDMLCGLKVYSPDEDTTKNVFILVAVSNENVYLEVSNQFKQYGLWE
jgi:hypothetical protein